jgi:hypothetical protein
MGLECGMTSNDRKSKKKGTAAENYNTKKNVLTCVNLFFHPPFVVDGCGWHHKFQTVFVGLTRICVASKTLDTEMPSKVRFCCWNNFHLRFLLHIKQTRKNNSNTRKTISWDYLDLANKSGQHCFCFVFFYVFSFALSVPKQIERKLKHNKCCRQVEGTFTVHRKQQLIRQLNVERQT